MAEMQQPESDGADAGGVIDALAGMGDGAFSARVNALRPTVARHTGTSYAALLEPDDPAGLSRREREMVALRVATLERHPEVAMWHRERLRGAGADDAAIAAVEAVAADANGDALTPREVAILRHTDLLTREPGATTPAHVAALKAAGLAPRDIVTLSQLIALMSYEVRLLAGLRALHTGADAQSAAVPPETAHAAPRSPLTMDVLAWRPWLETVDDTGATPEQAALVSKVAPSPESRPYYALLAHDLPALEERTLLFNAVMYGPGGVRRSDRELASTAASVVNGCVYCTSVHARRYAQLTKDAPTMQRLLDEGTGAALPERERAVVDYAVRLTRHPAGIAAGDLAPLRAAGLTDGEILDVTLSTAMFAWANRLMQTLGEGVPSQ